MRGVIRKLRVSRARLIGIAALGVLLLIATAIIYVVRLNRSIARERDRRADANRIEVEERPLRAPSTDGLTLYLNASDVRAVAGFEGARYLATSGGLIALDEGGNLKRPHTSFDGLPATYPTALAVSPGKVFVGTPTADLS